MIENAKPQKRGFWPTFGDLKCLVSNEDSGSRLTAIQMKKQFWKQRIAHFLTTFGYHHQPKQNEKIIMCSFFRTKFKQMLCTTPKRQKMEKPKKIFASDDVIWSVLSSSQLKKRSSNPEKSQF